jgi:hypothetical protein
MINSDYLQTYLKLNPQIEVLGLFSLHISQDQLNCISNECPDLTELSISLDNENYKKLTIPTFRYIKKLIIRELYLENFVILQKFCENCQESDHLTLNINENIIKTKELNKLLRNTVSRLNKLSTLEINTPYYIRWPSIYFFELKNLQTLLIRCSSTNIFDIKANQLAPQRLKVKVECSSTGKILNFINKAK